MSATLPGTLPGLLVPGSVVVHPKYGHGVVLDPSDPTCPAVFEGLANVLWGRCWLENGIADLSLDLTIPANRDRAARWLAERVGLTVGATAPEWIPMLFGEPLAYQLTCHYIFDQSRWPEPMQHSERALFCDVGAFPNAMGRRTVVPGISALTDPASALALAILAVSK